MRTLLAVSITGLLLALLVPAAVQAAAGAVTVQGKVGNVAPTVDAVVLLEDGSGNEVTAMTPLAFYRVRVTASDVNTLGDIREVEFHVYHGSDGSQWDADELAIFRWSSTAGWSLENDGAETTWQLDEEGCSVPGDFGVTTGDWVLKFCPGKVARASILRRWHCSATVRDEEGDDYAWWSGGASMAAYSELGFDTGTVVFGDAAAGIELGGTGYITEPPSRRLTVEVTSNSWYALGVKSDATWSDGGVNTIALSGTSEVPTEPAQFSLSIDDEEAFLGPDGKPRWPEAITAETEPIFGYWLVFRCMTDAGAPEASNDSQFYMAMSLSQTGIREVVYAGTITFTVTN